ncbi:AI-2E family transporter [Oceaniglobus ichthyenteri]|uniref:AI-2E family transporter n=1 Tax=Oceaniglobus ichthyenteri TaxID=2136177 RepID=UPI000D3CD943|nr:AI-2E family transporter [Oceaniglobus ichthyenteri]
MQPDGQPDARSFQTLVLVALFVVLLGYLLIIGKVVLLPIFVAVISVYILVSASDWMGRQPVMGWLPTWARRALVLLGFIIAIAALTGVVISTAVQLAAEVSTYQKNVRGLATRLFETFGVDVPTDWDLVWNNTVGKINLQLIATRALGSLSSLAGVIFLVVIYAMFLMGERGGFAYKVAIALPGQSGRRTQEIISSINTSIGDYLAIKTLINIILASISYVIMWAFGVDFALFWAILIGLLNYIPYVGSLIGVLFPVLLTMAQFGSIQTTILIFGFLTGAQLWVGNMLEPLMIGRKVNLSPFIVLVSLTLWTSLWGVAGSILAIPLTSILSIVLSHFAATHPISILLSDDPDHVIKPNNLI